MTVKRYVGRGCVLLIDGKVLEVRGMIEQLRREGFTPAEEGETREIEVELLITERDKLHMLQRLDRGYTGEIVDRHHRRGKGERRRNRHERWHGRPV